MCSRVFVFLIGAAFLCYVQDLAAENIYVAELMVESNVTLDAQTILTILKTTNNFQVSDSNGASHTVTLLPNELQLVAECLLVGDDITCSCSDGYTWSNEVCYTYSCCTETVCTQNVSYVAPLCIAKVNVKISGSVILQMGTWSIAQTTMLTDAFKKLNGFQYLNLTGQRPGNAIADFEVSVTIKFDTSMLQNIVNSLQGSLTAVVLVNTEGMVTIDYPNMTMCYLSNPQMKCTFEEVTDSSGWNLTTDTVRYDLNNGSVVQLDNNCATPEYNSCITITIQQATGLWEGIYECGFTKGSIRHIANAQIHVALLPDVIQMTFNPLTADCTQIGGNVIEITATIAQDKENYDVWWTYKNDKHNVLNTSINNDLVYNFEVTLNCDYTSEPQYVNITFKNSVGQEKSAQVVIPVIYVGKPFCQEDQTDGEFWPKTPDGATVINQTCPVGRTGIRSRTCQGSTWLPVFSECISQEMKNILNEAEAFLTGLGSTQEMAMQIFEGLQNSSTSASSNTTADVMAFIKILDVMATASTYVVLQEDILPSMIHAASNILNKTWDDVNSTVIQNMSANYLQSLESLVKNIKVNMSSGVNSTNLALKISRDCNVSVFGINVNLNKTNGLLKSLGVKNLMTRLRNNLESTHEPTSLLLSATLEGNNDSLLEIRLDFPKEAANHTKPFCVFWNTTKRIWSNDGCIFKRNDNESTVCQCNHLTSFSVLMAKGEINLFGDTLDKITSVGLGVSICSLLIYLIIESVVWSAVVKSNLSHFRHTAMVNIAVFLLLADCCFLASSSPEVLSNSWCLTLTICKHLFFLIMFGWMLCLSAMLVHQLIFVFSPLRKRVFMFLSSIVGYVCPILIVGCSFMYYKYTNKPYHSEKTCWLIYERLLEGSIHAFLLPLGTIILSNLFSMVVVILTLVKTSVPDSSKADDKDTVKSILKVLVLLTPVFGVTWIIGFFQLMLTQDNPMFAFVCFSFTILNSFQGFFILLTGCFAEQKVREELFKIIMAKSKGKSSSMKNMTTVSYTKHK